MRSYKESIKEIKKKEIRANNSNLRDNKKMLNTMPSIFRLDSIMDLKNSPQMLKEIKVNPHPSNKRNRLLPKMMNSILTLVTLSQPNNL